MICISLVVSDNFEALVRQIDNLLLFLPRSWVMVHVGLAGMDLRKQLRRRRKDVPGLFVNSRSAPILRNWTLHAHLQNFVAAATLCPDFKYFAIEEPDTLYFKQGAEDFVQSCDYLSDNLPLAAAPETLQGPAASARQAKLCDPCFLRMLRELGCGEVRFSLSPGSVYRRELFQKVLEILEKYYIFDLAEPKYRREEVYLPTLAAHLSGSRGPRLSAALEAAGLPPEETLKRVGQLASMEDGRPPFALHPVPPDHMAVIQEQLPRLWRPKAS